MRPHWVSAGAAGRPSVLGKFEGLSKELQVAVGLSLLCDSMSSQLLLPCDTHILIQGPRPAGSCAGCFTGHLQTLMPHFHKLCKTVDFLIKYTAIFYIYEGDYLILLSMLET